MDATKWQSVLIEWVNCLNLSKAVTSLSELKDGEFFGKLLAELVQNPELESCSNVCDSYVVDFLKKHYPSYGFEHESFRGQDALDVTHVCSLLLHYCCIRDCRAEFISPLCENLSLPFQVYVKQFLEDLQVAHELTRDVLKDAISGTHKLSSTPTKPYSNSPYSSPKFTGSSANPLLEFFRTPLKKYQLNYELQKKELKSLAAQVDLERFEKADLQEELKIQYEKNKKLDKKIADKHAEISRLRSELLSLESKTPPSCNKTEGRQENKRLRDEIVSLEKYVQILHKEHEELQRERDSARDRLQRIEEQCNDWQSKALHIERYCSRLTEEKQTQEDELAGLRERCGELEAMLSEFRPKPQCDESYEMDVSSSFFSPNRSGAIDTESLARTVVDIQLLDAQEDNKSLRKQLTDLELNSTALTSQMVQLQSRLNQLTEENTRLQGNNDGLQEKVLLLERVQQQLADTRIELLKCSADLEQRTASTHSLNASLAELTTKLTASDNYWSEARLENERLMQELKTTTDQNNNLLAELNTRNEDYEGLQSVYENVQLQLNESIQKALLYESKHGKLQLTLEKFSNDLRKCLVKPLDRVTEDTRAQIAFEEDGIPKLQSLISELETRLATDANDRKALSDTCETLKSRIKDLTAEVSKLTEIEVSSNGEIERLKVWLLECESKIHHFETVVTVSYERAVEEYKKVIEEKCGVIVQLTKLKDVVQERNDLIAHLETDKSELHCTITKLESNAVTVNAKMNSLESDKSALKEQLEQLDKNKLELHENLCKTEEELANEKRFVEKLQGDLENMKTVLTERNGFIKSLDMQKMLLDKRVTGLQEDLNEELKAKQDLQTTCSGLEEQMAEKTGLVDELEQERTGLRKKVASLEKHLSDEVSFKEELKNCNVRLTALVADKEECIAELESAITNANKQMEIVTCELNETKQQREQVQSYCTELSQKITEKEDRVRQLADEISCLNQQVEEMTRDVDEANRLKEELEKIHGDLKEDVVKKNDRIQALETETSVLNENIRSSTDRITDLENTMAALHQEFENAIIALKADQAKDIDGLVRTMSEQSEQITNLQEQIEQFTAIICRVNEELFNMQNTLRTEQANSSSIEKSKGILEDLQENVLTLKEHLAIALAVQTEAAEELASRNAELAQSRQLYEDFRHEMEMNIEELNANLTMQLGITTVDSEISGKVADDRQMQVLKDLEKIQCQEVIHEKEQLKELSREMHCLKQNIASLAHEKDCATGEIDTLRKQVGILERLKADVANKHAASELESTIKIAELTRAHEHLQSEIARNTADLTVCRNELDYSQRDLSETQAALKELIRTHNGEIENYEEELKQLQETNAAVANDYTELKEREHTLTTELLQVKQELEQTVAKHTLSLDQQAAHKHDTEVEIAELHKRLEASRECFAELQQNNSELAVQLAQSILEIETQKSLCSNFELKVCSLTSDSTDVQNRLESQLKTLVTERDALKADAERLYAELAGIKADKQRLEEQAETALVRKREVHAEWTMQNTALREEIEHYKSLEGNWTAEMSRLRARLQKMEADKAELDKTHKEYTETSDNKLQTVKAQYESSLEKTQVVIENLNSLLTEARENVVRLNKGKESLAEEHALVLREKQDDIEKLQAENDQLRASLQTLADDKNVLATKLDELTDDLLRLRTSETEADEKFRAKTRELAAIKEKLELVLAEIVSAGKALEADLRSVSETLANAEETLTETKAEMVYEMDENESLTTKVQYEIRNLTKQITSVVAAKHQIRAELEMIQEKATSAQTKKEQEFKNYELKLRQVQEECELKLKTIESHNRDIISGLESKLALTDADLACKIDEISAVNAKLMGTIDQVRILQLEKSNILSHLEIVRSELTQLRETRDALALETKNACKELDQSIFHAHESLEKMKSEFVGRLEAVDQARADETELKRQLENFLTAEKQTVELLEGRVAELTAEKEGLLGLCKSCNNHVHNLYRALVDVEETAVCRQRETHITGKLALLYAEREIVDEECDAMYREIRNLRAQCTELAAFELVKADHASLQERCDLLAACESENNGLRAKIADLGVKLADLQLENVKCQEHSLKQHGDLREKFEAELSLVKTTCASWQKKASDSETEHKKMQTEKQALQERTEELTKIEKDFERLTVANGESERRVSELQEKVCDLERTLQSSRADEAALKRDYQELAEKTPLLEAEIAKLHQNVDKYRSLLAEIEAEHERVTASYKDLVAQHKGMVDRCSQEHGAGAQSELAKLRTAYSSLMADNARFQLDCTVLRTTLDDRNAQLGALALVKESYERLLEDNNKVNLEIDTLRYKRARDKEEFKRLLDEQRAKASQPSADAQIQEVRNEYEDKLKKMKHKIVKLYQEEVDKERRKVTSKQQEHVQQDETISSLKSQLWMTGNKYVDLKRENEKLADELRALRHQESEDVRGSRESVSSLRERRPVREVDERRMCTLPRDAKLTMPSTTMRQSVDIIEESVTYSRRRSVNSNLDHGLKMEDEEGEFFNNTYLADLKAGRCTLASQPTSGRESVASSRLSELQYRNSMCLPHLKSSYPAETQFSSPGQFKEEDIKMGNVDLDDSMSSSLLPGEKPRTKKDWGQTLYKKPGPPTPSKNGGRLSLQGNEAHPRDVLREHNDNLKPQDRPRTISTPGRIKSLFTRNSSAANGSSSQRSNDTENHTTPQRTKRRSIFRR